ncbi:MAG: TfoX/Sxy family protein [Nitrospira sp.]|nr:TfoX/Sxy family protein [Nitrospira sp.]
MQRRRSERMFGRLCLMFNGQMCCGIEKGRLMVRVLPDRYDALLKKPRAREMDCTGKSLKECLWRANMPSPKLFPTSVG